MITDKERQQILNEQRNLPLEPISPKEGRLWNVFASEQPDIEHGGYEGEGRYEAVTTRGAQTLPPEKRGSDVWAPDSKYNFMELVGNVEGQVTTDKFVSDFAKFEVDVQNGERLLLAINSPGGYVEGSNEVLRTIESSKLPVDTYVNKNAFSMGAEYFMQGERRYIEPNAELLFHGTHIEGTTAPALRRSVHALQSQAAVDPSNPQVLEELARTQRNLEVLDADNSSFVSKMAAKLGKSHAWVEENIYLNFERDHVMTGRRAFQLGIATHLGSPDGNMDGILELKKQNQYINVGTNNRFASDLEAARQRTPRIVQEALSTAIGIDGAGKGPKEELITEQEKQAYWTEAGVDGVGIPASDIE